MAVGRGVRPTPVLKVVDDTGIVGEFEREARLVPAMSAGEPAWPGRMQD